MKTIWIVIASVISTIDCDVETILKTTHARHTKRFNDILHGILRENNFHDAIMVVDDSWSQHESTLVAMFGSFARRLPIISLTETYASRVPLSARATSNTLITYIHASRSLPGVFQMKRMVDVVRLFVLKENQPKILLVMLTDEKGKNLEYILRYVWEYRILRIAILEFSKTSEVGYNKVAIHHYDPFRRVYSRTPWSSRVQWFPERLKDLHGYPIEVDMFSRPPYSSVIRDSNGYPLKYDHAPDGKLLNILRDIMNFIILTQSHHSESFKLAIINDTITGSMDLIQKGQVEFLMTTLPYVFGPENSIFARTQSIGFEKWCALVPIVYKSDTLHASHFFHVVLVSLSIVLIFWLISILMKLDVSIWYPANIVRILLSSSIPRAPTRTVERVLLFSAIVVSAMYSVNLFISLTRVKLEQKVPIELKTFEDLDKSGLTPMISELQLNRTFVFADDVLINLKRKSIVVPETSDCLDYLAKHMNVTCMVVDDLGRNFISKMSYNGEANLMMTDLCYFSPLIGYIFHKYSPYVSRVNDIILRVASTGIRDKWNREFFWTVPSDSDAPDRMDPVTGKQNRLFDFELIFVALCGYLVSLFAFFCELFISFFRSG